MYFEVKETQSGLGTSRTGYPVGLGTSRTGYPVRLGDRSEWYPVTQSGTGTGASLTKSNLEIRLLCYQDETSNSKLE